MIIKINKIQIQIFNYPADTKVEDVIESLDQAKNNLDRSNNRKIRFNSAVYPKK